MPKRQSTNPLSPDSIPLLVTKSKLKEKMNATGSTANAAANSAASSIENSEKKPENLKGNFKKWLFMRLIGIKKHDLHSTVQLSSNEVSNIDFKNENESITEKPVGLSPNGDQLVESDKHSEEEEDNDDDDQEEDEYDDDEDSNSKSEQDDGSDNNEDEEHDQSNLNEQLKADSFSCIKAANVSGSIASIQSQFDCNNCYKLREELANTKLKFEGLMTTQHEWEAGKMHRRLGILEDELENKENELLKVKYDMEILGEKLIDEIEKRAEITAANDSVQGEIEELTQSLFVRFFLSTFILQIEYFAASSAAFFFNYNDFMY